ncbi:hypothetical protein [Marinitoga lauensis]|nr:hypothetical protein [Marinitoga lauensis]
MVELGKKFPEYNFKKHKGYPQKNMLKTLKNMDKKFL